jgi:hypothetical protein
LTIPLLAQYYSTSTAGCSLWGAHSWACLCFLQRPDNRREVARFDLTALFAYQEPVIENFTGNLANVCRSSATRTIRNNVRITLTPVTSIR